MIESAIDIGERRNQDDILDSLKQKTGVTPTMVKFDLDYKTGLFGGIHESRKTAWRDLATKIADMGPCILSKEGHDVMLDGVREEKGKFYLTIRDPYHGTCMEFEDSADFFPDLTGSKHKTGIEAVFLGKPSQTQ